MNNVANKLVSRLTRMPQEYSRLLPAWKVWRIIFILLASQAVADSTNRTLVIGDSLTVGMFNHGAFPSNFVQLAAGGATTEYAAERLEGSIDFSNGPILRPQVTNSVIFLGVNDYYWGVDPTTFINSYERLISFIDPSTELFCVGLTPMPERNDRPPQIFYATWIKDMCEKNGGTYISPYPALTKDGQVISEYFAPDRLHLSFEGSRALGHYILGILNR